MKAGPSGLQHHKTTPPWGVSNRDDENLAHEEEKSDLPSDGPTHVPRKCNLDLAKSEHFWKFLTLTILHGEIHIFLD